MSSTLVSAPSTLRPSARLPSYALEIGCLFVFAELNAAPTFFELNAARIETVCVGCDEGCFVTDAST
jgi:hypothetical protein